MARLPAHLKAQKQLSKQAKGSKSNVTLLKMIGEEAIRSECFEEMLNVCRIVIDEARQGDKTCMRMVWDAMITKGIPTDKQVSEKVEINIGSIPAARREVNVINQPKEEDINEQ